MREAYDRDGFLVLPGFASAADCDALIARAAGLASEHRSDTVSIFSTHEQTRTSDEHFLSSGDQIRCFFEEDGRSINKLGHAMHDLDPVYAAFSRRPALGALARELGLANPVLLQSMHIFKHPFVGGEVTLHQDHTFLWTEPQSVTGFWFALEDATLENGCMFAVPGSHRSPARKRFRRAGQGTRMDVVDESPVVLDGEVPLVAPKGTCVVLHGLLLHRSGANTSPKSRQAYSVHTIDATADYPADNWLQRPALPLRGF